MCKIKPSAPAQEWEEKLDEYWNEHDGTNFYKDELRDLIKHLLLSEREKVIAEIKKHHKELLKKDQKVIFTINDVRQEYNQAVSDILTSLSKEK